MAPEIHTQCPSNEESYKAFQQNMPGTKLKLDNERYCISDGIPDVLHRLLVLVQVHGIGDKNWIWDRWVVGLHPSEGFLLLPRTYFTAHQQRFPRSPATR